MDQHRFRRAILAALVTLVAFAGSVAADSVAADGDRLSPQIDGTRHVGDVRPGATVSLDVRFVVTCGGLQHVDAGQAVALSWSGAGIVPLDGAIVSVTSATLAPLTTAWATDSEGCPTPTPSYDGGVLSEVTLRAPTSAGSHLFTIVWDRLLQPAGTNDPNALRGVTALDVTMRVVADSPPTLSVPADFTVEGDTVGGWTAVWSVSATDQEDTTPPTPACLPATGSLFPLGDTTVSCSVTDSGGLTDSGSFVVTVVDTTPPALSGLPADLTITTSEETGVVVEFDVPTATDIVDPSPVARCDPPSGVRYPVGATTVTCSATDASGRSSSGSFVVTVTHVVPPTASATWLEPAGGSKAVVAQRGRTVPVKVRLFVDGVAVSSGDARLLIAPCGATHGVERPLAWTGSRWDHALDTSDLSPGCHRLTALIDGLAAGTLHVDVRGESDARSLSRRRMG